MRNQNQAINKVEFQGRLLPNTQLVYYRTFIRVPEPVTHFGGLEKPLCWCEKWNFQRKLKESGRASAMSPGDFRFVSHLWDVWDYFLCLTKLHFIFSLSFLFDRSLTVFFSVCVGSRDAVVSAALSERRVTGSIPTIGDFYTVGSCKKAVFACLATDVK